MTERSISPWFLRKAEIKETYVLGKFHWEFGDPNEEADLPFSFRFIDLDTQIHQ